LSELSAMASKRSSWSLVGQQHSHR
jgi:hypothetical protein